MEHDLIIFTHIQKTGGTSLFEHVVSPHFQPEEVYDNATVKRFWFQLKPEHRVVKGHVAYGLHRMTRRSCTYITLLREPVDRCISHYSFIKAGKPAHDLYENVTANSMKSFYEQPQFHNEMTRMLAGIGWQRIAPYAPSARAREYLLGLAKRHLEEKYTCFGITERLDASISRFEDFFGWKAEGDMPRRKVTRAKPSPDEIDAETMAVLQEANELDARLYRFACELFEERGSRTGRIHA